MIMGEGDEGKGYRMELTIAWLNEVCEKGTLLSIVVCWVRTISVLTISLDYVGLYHEVYIVSGATDRPRPKCILLNRNCDDA